jgi:hypothetical protein
MGDEGPHAEFLGQCRGLPVVVVSLLEVGGIAFRGA